MLLASCDGGSSSSSSSSQPEVKDASLSLSVNEGGKALAYYKGSLLGTATSSSPVSLSNLKNDRTLTVKIILDEGYSFVKGTFNTKRLSSDSLYFPLSLQEGENTASFSFSFVETKEGDFTFVTDSETKEATISDYAGSNVPTPLEIPNTYTKDGVTYKVTKLNKGALDNAEVTKIKIPANLTNIEAGSFNNVYNLTDIVVDEANEAYSSEDGILFNKDKTILVAAPMMYKAASYEVPNTMTEIGEYAFYSNKVLSSISFPTSVTTIDKYAFASTSKLKNVILPTSLLTLGDYSFYQSTALESISLNEGLTSIGNSAFYSTTKLRELECPSTLTSIGSEAFFKCDRLSNISFNDGLQEIGTSAFSNLTSLLSVSLPSGLKKLGNSAFSACDQLETITLNEGLEEIGNYSFALCSKLSGLSIPSSVTTIGNNPFYGVLKLNETNFKIATGNSNFLIENGVLFNSDKTKLISYPYGLDESGYSIPSSVTTLGNMCFALENDLKKLDMPVNVTRIDESFYGVTSTLNINYAGTKENFTSIDKKSSKATDGYAWNEGAESLITVTCTDGEWSDTTTSE